MVGASYTLATSNVGVEAGARGQLAGGEDRRLAEVDADDAGAEARPAEGVHAEVALEVDEVEAGDVAGLLDLVPTKWRATCQKAVDAVEVGGDVDRDALVPPGAVELEPGVVHRRSSARTRNDRLIHGRDVRRSLLARTGRAGTALVASHPTCCGAASATMTSQCWTI